jgi:hypothetical protein
MTPGHFAAAFVLALWAGVALTRCSLPASAQDHTPVPVSTALLGAASRVAPSGVDSGHLIAIAWRWHD